MKKLGLKGSILGGIQQPELTRPMPLEADSGFDGVETGEDTTSPCAPFKTAHRAEQPPGQTPPKL